ncbi:hypothetical protein SYNPS1DRAFT_25365 [Syncephalis pseudoplumigaleata]|uniref:Uncharacterized protein n=1 Tax=Syncephalis pseudoplumigaleata TaxID=1712513 RepID=A0A4P9YS90_9FUNG|nr:hypothetical protein SYNPS1DRAFT_25365 [Syncephalis pseudoplumigaleata]|eukprot:RKP22766.1 hypothetical protein SYNPS1DRAFT_25365 [Syncephalis pseudoplumigaleata]
MARVCLDKAVKAQLYVEILNRCIFFLEHKNTLVCEKIEQLIDSINTELSKRDDADEAAGPTIALRGTASSSLADVPTEQLLPHVVRYYKKTSITIKA